MDNLPLKLSAIAGIFFLFSRGNKAKAVSKPKVSLDPKDQTRGYQIIDCNKVVIFDIDKALDYAYQQGVDFTTGQWEEVLFDKCIKPLTQGLGDFKFNMTKAAATGAVDIGKYDENKMLNLLQNLKDLAESNGLNTAKWVVEIPKKK